MIIKERKNLFKSTNFNLQIHNTFYNSKKHHEIRLKIITELRLNPFRLCVSLEVRQRNFSQKLKSLQITSKLAHNLFQMCWLRIWTKKLKILSPKCSKWHKMWHKWPKIEIAQNFLVVGIETISSMLITNMNKDFKKAVT